MRRETSRLRMRAAWGLAFGVGLVVGAPLAAVEGARHEGPYEASFAPAPLPPAKYGMAAATQTLQVPVDEAELFVEVWRPEARLGGVAPPARLPLAVMITPYAMKGRGANTGWDTRSLLVERGYAYAVVHARGTGSSGGCAEGHTQRAADDASAAIDALLAQPWADGRVALLGLSNAAAEALNVLVRGDESARAAVKAVVVGAPPDDYDWLNFDGVTRYANGTFMGAIPNRWGLTPYSSVDDLLFWGEPPERFVETKAEDGGIVAPEHVDDRVTACGTGPITDQQYEQGSHHPGYAARRWKLGVDAIDAPTLFYQGLDDAAVTPHTITGLFDRLAGPKAGVFGRFGHTKPPRPDWDAMTYAWVDRWVRGARNGADQWPVAQVEAPDGTWRADAGYPRVTGRTIDLTLGRARVGDAAPVGSSSFITAAPIDHGSAAAPLGGELIFETEPLAVPLHVTGAPALDLTLDVDGPRRDDAHVAADLIPIGPDGGQLAGATFGARSLRHLEPIENDVFTQAEGRSPPPGTLHVPMRFSPVDMKIPAGGRLRLRIGSSSRIALGPDAGLLFHDPTWAEPGAVVTVHHDCASSRLTTLRLTLPRTDATYLRVGELAPAKRPNPIERPTDGGLTGLAPCEG